MGEIAGFNTATALMVVSKVKKTHAEQLALLAEIKAFANGVLRYINEQRSEKHQNK